VNASERRYARKLARQRTRELVAIRRAVALAEGARGVAGGSERSAVDEVPRPRTAG
jgi:hypothetical protein